MKWPLPLVLLALSACDDGQTHMSVTGQVSGGVPVYAAPMLDAAKRDFFGGGAGTGGGSMGGGTGGGTFGDLDGVVMRGRAPSVVAVTVTRSDPVAGLTLRSQIGAEYGELDASLPEGLGILTDPMRVTMWQRALRVQLTAGQRLGLGHGWRADYAAGFGWVQFAADGHFRSALIDLRSDSTGGVPYAVFAAGVIPPRGPQVTAGLLIYSGARAEFRLGLAQNF